MTDGGACGNEAGGGGVSRVKETLLVWDERDYDVWWWHTIPKWSL